jgi:ATP-dependent DNA ligase
MQMSAAGTREAAAEATRGFFIRMKVASFIQPMACLSVLKLPDGPLWVYEVKLDG